MRRARVGINAVYLDPTRMGGAETYVRHLISGLQQLDVAEDFFIFVARDHDLRITNPRFHLVECPVTAARRYRRIAWEELRLPALLRRHDLDLVHFPYGTMPYGFRGDAVVTIHDTVRFFFQHEMSRLRALRRRILDRRIAATNRPVIAVSRSDAGSITRYMGIPADHVFPVYHGVGEPFLARQPEPIDSRHGILWVGRPYPTKNLEVLIRACAVLLNTRHTLPPIRLVGIEPQHRRRVVALVESSGVSAHISLEPPVAHARLPELLASARVFVYPSRQESFGLPVLEAMASGTPVVCADIPTFRELHAHHAFFANPDSPERFAAAIDRLLTDPALWDDMSQRGRQHAAKFTWEACVRRTCAVYRTLLERAAARMRPAA